MQSPKREKLLASFMVGAAILIGNACSAKYGSQSSQCRLVPQAVLSTSQTATSISQPSTPDDNLFWDIFFRKLWLAETMGGFNPLSPLQLDKARTILYAVEQTARAENYRYWWRFAFLTSDEVQEAELGLPLKLSYITCRGLKNYSTENNHSKVIQRTNLTFWPVLVQGESRFLFKIEETPELLWRFSGFVNNFYLSDGIEKVRNQRLAEKEKKKSFSLIAVLLGTQDVYLLMEKSGRGAEKRELVTPILDYPGYKLSQGRTYPISDILALLEPYAP